MKILKHASTGVILRLKRVKSLKGDREGGIDKRYTGVMEWPDFSGIVRVKCEEGGDGERVVTEECLMSGASHAGWDVR